MTIKKSTLLVLCLIINLYPQVPNATDFISGSITAWDIDYHKENSRLLFKKLDSLEISIDTSILNQLTAGIDTIYEIVGHPPPVFMCGCGLGTIAKMQIDWKGSISMTIYWSCPNSKFQAQLLRGTRRFGIEFTKTFEEKAKQLINNARLNIFGKNRLFECGYDSTCQEK